MGNLSKGQVDNIKLIIASANKYGITNPNLQAALLATISKESQFIPQSENLNYSKKAILRTWSKTDDSVAEELAHNPERLGNYMYGGKSNEIKRYGNAPDEGYLYRGRGFNQITFKDNYKRYGDLLKIDLVGNPDKLNDPQVAADAAALFFKDQLKSGEQLGAFKKFGVIDTNKITDTTTATKVFIQMNGGLNTPFENNVLQEGYKQAILVVDDLKKFVSNNPVKSISIGGILLLTIVCLYFFNK